MSGSCFGSDEVTSATEAAAEAEKDSRLPDLMCWGTEVGFFLGRGMLTPCERGIAHLRYTPHTGRARAMSTYDDHRHAVQTYISHCRAPEKAAHLVQNLEYQVPQGQQQQQRRRVPPHTRRTRFYALCGVTSHPLHMAAVTRSGIQAPTKKWKMSGAAGRFWRPQAAARQQHWPGSSPLGGERRACETSLALALIALRDRKYLLLLLRLVTITAEGQTKNST